MREETMRLVMIKYFKFHSIDVIPQRGAGPDLHIKGKGVVEVKGSKYDFAKMLRQLIDYAMKHPEVTLALPYDGLTFERVQQLLMLSILIDKIDSKFTLYVVAPAPEGNNFFYVKHFKTMNEVELKMGAYMQGTWGLDPKHPTSTIKVAVENLIKYSPIEVLKKEICTDYDNTTSRIQI